MANKQKQRHQLVSDFILGAIAMNDEEEYLIEMIEQLRQHYEKAAEPYIRRVCEIRSMRVDPVLVTHEMLAFFGITNEGIIPEEMKCHAHPPTALPTIDTNPK